MDLRDFFTSSRVLVVAGKGGVGKTTVSVVLAAAAAGAGLRCLLVVIGGRAETTEGVGMDPDIGRIVEGTGTLEVTTLTPAGVLSEAIAARGAWEVDRQMERREQLSRHLGSWSPGVGSMLLLAKIRQLSDRPDVDLVVVDAPATGSASMFLQAPSAALDTVRGGEVRKQAEKAQAMLTDPSRCLVTLVTVPAESPVNELVESAYQLEDELNVKLGPVIVNAVETLPEGLPDPASWTPPADLGLAGDELASLVVATRFTLARHEVQTRELERLAEELPLPRLELPLIPSVGLDDDDLRGLVSHLELEVRRLDAGGRRGGASL